MTAPWHDVVVLAGGSARRLGGLDKPALLVGGTALLDRVLQACGDARRSIVVGPRRATERAVLWTREEPAGSGPVPALEAGLSLVTAPRVLVLAADLPFFSAACATRLVHHAPAVIWGDGQPQWLCSAWDTEDLLRAVATATTSRLGDVLGSIRPALLAWDGADRPWQDCDTEQDLRRAREQADEHDGRLGELSGAGARSG